MSRGRLTVPTDVDIVSETIETMKKWGADALRDADGTEFPVELKEVDAKIYATYYTTRKDNKWAKQNPDEVQQCYICTNFHTAFENLLEICLTEGVSKDLICVNDIDDIYRWWEVIDRTTGAVIESENWSYDNKSESVYIKNCTRYHEYSVSYLAYLIWDPVHMYNSVVNDWQDTEHQITFDVRQPKTKEFSKNRLRKFLQKKQYVDVVRFTTFFHQFTLLFDELKREKYVDWYGYSASVSPFILEQFEKEVGYIFRAEYIIDEGYYNNQYRIPTKEYMDFMAFQRREVATLAKELVDITHKENREAMMFLGDHWIGTEPYMEEFKAIGLDAVVGSVGNGSTLRLISDIEGVKYTEGRFLPYFFPDVFLAGGNPVAEAKDNWITARRALLRKPVDRIGYGGYLKLALQFPEFVDYITQIADEFRLLYENIDGAKPYCAKKVAILNCWGKMRSWGCHMVHHALYHKQNTCYAGVIESLSGAPFEVVFISFDDILFDSNILNSIDVVINVGTADTAHSGGWHWSNPKILQTIRSFVSAGGGLIGIGEPSAYQYQGHFFQLANVLGVEKETSFTLGYDKYNWEQNNHFITDHMENVEDIDFGHGASDIYALANTKVIVQRDKEVKLAVNNFGKGRAVYISGLPFDFTNNRLLYRAILWSSTSEELAQKWFCENINIEVNVYESTGKYCLVNNSLIEQKTIFYDGTGRKQEVFLTSGEIKWYGII